MKILLPMRLSTVRPHCALLCCSGRGRGVRVPNEANQQPQGEAEAHVAKTGH